MISCEALHPTISAIFDKEVIKKMHLLKEISSKCNEEGSVVASSLMTILLLDFVRAREKEKKSGNIEYQKLGKDHKLVV
jgi:hypothetical protein